jgi:hypothetical protein
VFIWCLLFSVKIPFYPAYILSDKTVILSTFALSADACPEHIGLSRLKSGLDAKDYARNQDECP